MSNQVNFKIFAGNIEEKISYILGGIYEIYREVLEIFLIVRTTINVCVYVHIYVCCIHIYKEMFSFHFTSLIINLVCVKLNLYIFKYLGKWLKYTL